MSKKKKDLDKNTLVKSDWFNENYSNLLHLPDYSIKDFVTANNTNKTNTVFHFHNDYYPQYFTRDILIKGINSIKYTIPNHNFKEINDKVNYNPDNPDACSINKFYSPCNAFNLL